MFIVNEHAKIMNIIVLCKRIYENNTPGVIPFNLPENVHIAFIESAALVFTENAVFSVSVYRLS